MVQFNAVCVMSLLALALRLRPNAEWLSSAFGAVGLGLCAILVQPWFALLAAGGRPGLIETLIMALFSIVSAACLSLMWDDWRRPPERGDEP